VRLQLNAATPTAVLLPVHQSVEQVSRLYPDVRLEVACDLTEQDTLVNITGGPATLKRIIENLVINACQAQSGAQDQQVRCSIELNARSVVLTVSDDGPGFPGAIIQSHPSPLVSTKLGGSGMGLYSCHQLVHRDGGQLAIANRPNGGALVTVAWPRVLVSGATTVPPVSSSIQRSGLRVRPNESEMDAEMAKRRP
jgi:signal transduction histidine kinase